MVPLWVVLSLYYLAINLKWVKKEEIKSGDLARVKDKTYLQFVLDSTIGVWYGDNCWATATWTLSIELIATFMVYLLAQTVIEYRGR